MQTSMKRAVVLIDGVHKPDNTISGIRDLAGRIGFKPVRMVWIGGTEKIKDLESFRGEFRREFDAEVVCEGDMQSLTADPVAGMRRALENRDIDLVVQLSGAPQVNRRLMNRYASVAVGYGAAYVAGGTVFAEDLHPVEVTKPSAGLFATDKRVGKTAFGVYIAALMSGIRGPDTPWSSISITHSRGGPPEPPVLDIYRNPADTKSPSGMSLEELYSRRFTPEFLERLLDFGLHGASDVYEDALILSEYLTAWEAANPGVETPRMHVIGCRRAGAGYFHEFAVSNVELGLAAANRTEGNFILHEGSGGEHPPVRVDGTITLVPADTDLALLEDFPGLDTTDLVILAHCQPETVDAVRIDEVERILAGRNPELAVARTYFEPEVIGARQEVEGLRGRSVAFFTTAPKNVEKRLALALENVYGVKVKRICFSLARDDRMRADIDELMADSRPPDLFLMEIKARGVEGARYAREKHGRGVMYVNNIPRHVGADGNAMRDNSGLDRLILDALNKAVRRYNAREGTWFPVWGIA